MINRRLIRIKVFKELFSKVSTGSYDVVPAEKELLAACEKTRELYCLMLLLPVELSKMAQEKIDTGLQKFHPTAQEMNPSFKFAQNKFSELIANDEEFLKYCRHHKISWETKFLTVRSIFNSMCSREYFQEFINGKNNAVSQDIESHDNALQDADAKDHSSQNVELNKKAVVSGNEITPAGANLKESIKLFERIYKQELEDSEAVEDMLEEQCSLWSDDLGYVLLTILKDLKQIARSGKVSVPEVFMKEDDEAFAKKLLKACMVNYDEYTELAQSFLSKWDVERVVSTDLTLIVMGIAEAVKFETIPLKVTINEYVEISKYYSTPKSKVFVNGLLDRVLQKLQKEGKISKQGRGLVGNLD
ncbi:MAG TPA: transcription antitermination protein NusB [Candidatus Egerieousia sp.]|nr:transcription antitermination protein NusB [Candidatus Egerieousia sp.]